MKGHQGGFFSPPLALILKRHGGPSTITKGVNMDLWHDDFKLGDLNRTDLIIGAGGCRRDDRQYKGENEEADVNKYRTRNDRFI